MSKNVAVFIDVANLYYSARGQDVDVDYVALLKYATKGRDLIRAYAYSGLDPENENQRKFIDFLGKNGYSVLTKDIRKFGDGRVKANLDIELVVDLFRLANRMDIAVIVSGDGDFAPAITALQQGGVRCEVISFRPNTSSDLIAVADEFVDVMKIAGIGRGSKEAKAQRGMSMPEMPAKEVTPEFGFRDASPGVAAAALAALREGNGGRSGSRRGGGRARRADAPASQASEAPAATAAAATAEAPSPGGDGEGSGGETRRRRRRRGGRGRGRGRAPTEAGGQDSGTSTAETGWTEANDLSQLEGVGFTELDAEKEYSFEEADAATLAELGLTAADAAPAATPAEEAPAEKKPARRRTSARKAETADESKTAEKKPARRRTTARKAEEAAPADGASSPDEGEGIWQRFRSGRTTSR